MDTLIDSVLPPIATAIILLLISAFGVVAALAILCQHEARYWRLKAATWRSRANAYYRDAFAYRVEKRSC